MKFIAYIKKHNISVRQTRFIAAGLVWVMIFLLLHPSACGVINAENDAYTVSNFMGNKNTDACVSIVLMELSTGRVIYEKVPDVPLPPASVTKIMTLLLVMEAIEAGKIKYEDMVTVSANAASMGGSQIYLKENEQMSIEDLLKSVIIASANDAAVALAEHICGSEEAFVARMNAKAADLKMQNTYFENTNGLDDTAVRHVSSAKDIAIMSRALLKYPKITQYSSTWMDSVRDGAFGLTNTNRLVRYYKGANGLKTGYTSKAGFCISASAKRDGMTLICVIMGAPTRDVRNAAAASLFDYGFANFELLECNAEKLEKIKLSKGMDEYVQGQTQQLFCLLQKGQRNMLEKKVELKPDLTAPIQKGEQLGRIAFYLDGRVVAQQNIYALNEVKEITFVGAIYIFIKNLVQIFC